MIHKSIVYLDTSVTQFRVTRWSSTVSFREHRTMQHQHSFPHSAAPVMARRNPLRVSLHQVGKRDEATFMSWVQDPEERDREKELAVDAETEKLAEARLRAEIAHIFREQPNVAAILCYKLQKMENAQIAAKIGMSTTEVRKLLRRGRRRLREMFPQTEPT